MDVIEIDNGSFDSNDGWNERNIEYVRSVVEKIKEIKRIYMEKLKLKDLTYKITTFSNLILTASTMGISFFLKNDMDTLPDDYLVITLIVLNSLSFIVQTGLKISSPESKIDNIKISIVRLNYLLQYIEIQFHTPIKDRSNIYQLLYHIAHERDLIMVTIDA